jgi:hypothetical protein
MSYNKPLASVSSYGVMKVGNGLQVANGVVSNQAVALFDQGYFYNTTTQTNPVASAINRVAYNAIAVNVGITLVNTTELHVSRTANYNLQFSVQLQKTTGPSTTVNIWILKNGVAYPDTNTTIALTGSNTVLLAGWSYLLALLSTDYVEIAWESPDTTVTLTAVPAQVGPTRPVTPSARCTMVQL